MAVKKLGQPVPESNFMSEVKSGRPHPAHAKMPGRCSSFSGLVPARSVSSLRSTVYALPCRRFFHSSSESLRGSVGEGTLAPAGRKVFQLSCSALTSLMFLAGEAANADLPTDSAASALSRVRRFILVSFQILEMGTARLVGRAART